MPWQSLSTTHAHTHTYGLSYHGCIVTGETAHAVEEKTSFKTTKTGCIRTRQEKRPIHTDMRVGKRRTLCTGSERSETIFSWPRDCTCCYSYESLTDGSLKVTSRFDPRDVLQVYGASNPATYTELNGETENIYQDGVLNSASKPLSSLTGGAQLVSALPTTSHVLRAPL